MFDPKRAICAEINLAHELKGYTPVKVVQELGKLEVDDAAWVGGGLTANADNYLRLRQGRNNPSEKLINLACRYFDIPSPYLYPNTPIDFVYGDGHSLYNDVFSRYNSEGSIFRGRSELVKISQTIPKFRKIGELHELPIGVKVPENVERAAAIANEPKALAIIPKDNSYDEIEYRLSDYKTVQSLRNARKIGQYGDEIWQTHVNGVLLHEDGHHIFLMFRSNEVDVCKNCYHTFGGAVYPPREGNPSGGDVNSRNTLKRELSEEHEGDAELSKIIGPHAIVKNWKDTNLEINYLGVQVVSSSEPQKPGAEGLTKLIRLNKLTDTFSVKWSMSGFSQLMLWLGIGAPGASEKFHGEARRIFRDVMDGKIYPPEFS